MRIRSLLVLLIAATGTLTAYGAPSDDLSGDPSGVDARITLPIADYQRLTQRIATAEAARRAAKEDAPPIHTLLSLHIRAIIHDDPAGDAADGTAHLETTVDIEVAGTPRRPVPIPIAGRARDVRIVPDDRQASLDRDAAEGLVFIAPEAGRYRIVVDSRSELVDGVLRLPASKAAVNTATLDLASGLEVGLGDTVAVNDVLVDDRRRLSLSLAPGRDHEIDLRPGVVSTKAEELLLDTTVVTVIEVLREHLRRRDVVLFEVLRGGSDRMAVTLPPDYTLDRVESDEGAVAPRLEPVPLASTARADSAVPRTALTVERRETLRGQGHLVLTERPRPLAPDTAAAGDTDDAGFALAPVVPAAATRARFLVLAPTIATRVTPLPVSAWQQVDLEDLPERFGAALTSLGPSGVWRLRRTHDAAATPVRLVVAPLPAAERAGSVIERRETTSLLTDSGVLVHRDRLSITHADTAVAIQPPTDGELWSALVDGQPVRPVTTDTALLVPIAYRADGRAQVEIVTMVRQALPSRRGTLAFSVPEIDAPILAHSWKLLLPDDRRYRLVSSDLSPVAVPGRNRATRAVTSPPPRPKVGPTGTGRGSLIGTITDSQGAHLPGVTVELSGLGTPQHAFTNAHGTFRFVGLDPGQYALVASLDGFSTVEYPYVGVGSGRNTTVEIQLSAAIEETITVTAESPGSMGQLVDGRALRRERLEAAERRARIRAEAFSAEAGLLQESVVSGVKPLAIQMPQSGKILMLSGALPPTTVEAVIETRPGG